MAQVFSALLGAVMDLDLQTTVELQALGPFIGRDGGALCPISRRTELYEAQDHDCSIGRFRMDGTIVQEKTVTKNPGNPRLVRIITSRSLVVGSTSGIHRRQRNVFELGS